MRKREKALITQVFILTMAVVVVSLSARGQSAADLLQKGIYTQETVGDLDGAIKIYSQIVNSVAQSRTYAAQAQYRIGVCLLKKSENTEATKAFEKLIRDYPEEKELIAKAREHLPNEWKLLPIPWAEDELAEYRTRLEDGQYIGTLVYSIEPAPGDPRTAVILVREYGGAIPARLSRVEIDKETLRPLRSSFKIMMLNEYLREYRDKQVQVKVGNKQPRTVALEGPAFDNDEAPYLLRRLPLANGTKMTIPFMNPSGLFLKGSLVVSEEDVQVPAGKFHCYKVELTDVNQTIWIGEGPSRPLVKIESMGIAELAGVRKIDRRTPVHYEDTKAGISFTAPPGWIAHPEEVTKPDEAEISLLDPEAKIPLTLWVKQVKTIPSEIDRELRASVDKRVEEHSSDLKGYQIPADSIKVRQIGGNQTLSCVAEYLRGQQKMVEYLTWIRSENANALFSSTGQASALDEFRKRLDPILETVKLK